MGQNFSSLEYDNCRGLTHVPMPMQCFLHVKVNFEKKNPVLPIEKIVTTPYYPFFAPLSVKWSLKGGYPQRKCPDF